MAHVSQHACVGQLYGTKFFHSIFIWVPAIEVRSLGLCGKCSCLLSHLANPIVRYPFSAFF